MEFGNIKLSKIVQMKIETLGNKLFDDTDFIPSLEGEPEWKNFKQKIKDEKDINLESVLRVDDRIKRIKQKKVLLVYGVKNDDELKKLSEDFSQELKNVIASYSLFSQIVYGFLDQLKKNIVNFVPCDIPQDKIFQYTLSKHINKIVNPRTINPMSRQALENFSGGEKYDAIVKNMFLYFFKKNDMGLYEPSLEKSNEAVKKAFKEKGKKLDDLKVLVDTDKGTNLNNASVSWNTYKKVLLDEGDVFKGIDRISVIQYKLSYSIYIMLRNFDKVADSFLSQTIRSNIIEDVIDYIRDCESAEDYPVPKSSMKHILCDDYEELRDLNSFGSYRYFLKPDEFDIDFFWYDRKSPDDMKPILEHGFQEKYIDMIFLGRSKYFAVKPYGADSFSKEEELYFREKICCMERIGKSAPFFFEWYGARIEYAEFHRGRSKIEDVSQMYLKAYDTGLYFAGKYMKEFVEEAIKVFLEEYKCTKRTGRIKEMYQYATALGLTLQLYKEFKDAGFSDPAINPWQFYIALWDSGWDVVKIARLSGLSWQMVRKILYDNEKFLKRNDKASLDELGRYIPRWECDEYGINTDEIWD